MSNWTNETEAREHIKALVAEYYHDFKEKKEPFKEGDRISYASRVFDEKEMQAYYQEIAPRLTNYLVSDGTPYEQACDIVQESFIRVWQHRDKLTAEDSISGLVFRIAKNIKIDNFRKYRKEVLVEEYEDSVVPAVEDNQENSPEDTQYLRSCINKALDSLNKDLRTCYTLYNVGEMPIKDIAEMLGISESLVKVRIHRAKLFLAEKLQYLRDQGDF